MYARKPKQTTTKYLEIADPKDAVGLWSHRASYMTPLNPVGNTLKTLGHTLAEDISRWETYDEMKAAMDAKGWKKSASRRLREYAAQYLGEVVDEAGEREWLSAPRWFRAWRRFARWIDGIQTAPRPDYVRMSFGFATAGLNCNERNLRAGRTFFLRNADGRNFVAVMAVPASDPAWASWLLIENSNRLAGRECYKRLVVDPRGECRWTELDAALVTELVADKKLCLFELAPDPVFDAVTDPGLNPSEQYAHISTDFVFCAYPCKGAFTFALRWGVTYNPGRTRYENVDKNTILTLDIARERRKPWAKRPVEVRDCADAEKAAREVVLANGCALLPNDASDELRHAVMRALFFVTFPDRRPDEIGGLLRGYQLPGRMVRNVGKGLRGDNAAQIVERVREMGKARADARRQLVVDTLLARAAGALAARNGLDRGDALRRIESAGGRATLAAAAERLGMMDGNALALFTPKPGAGSLKLPDLSLAFAFELRLGLDGSRGESSAPLVQATRVRPLDETPGSMRHAVAVVASATRMWKPMRGREDMPLEVSPKHPPRILREDGRYYLLAVPRQAGAFRYDRDLAYETGGKRKSVPVSAYSFRSSKGERSRESVELVVETFDWQKVSRMARDGRMMLYALDFGKDRRWADAAYLPTNAAPCTFSTTVPKIEHGGTSAAPRASDEKASVRLTFVVNPTVRRDNRKWGVRSLAAYLDAYPDERARPRVAFDPASPADSALEAVRKDALLVARKEDAAAALEAMSYVVVPGRGLREPGGLYNGYMLLDRVFIGDAQNAARSRDPRKGKRLADVVRPGKVAALERHFTELIEADGVADKKSARRFKLERPLKVTPVLAPAVAREFRRVIYTGTMDARRQLVRPAHEVAVGIWLAGLVDQI